MKIRTFVLPTLLLALAGCRDLRGCGALLIAYRMQLEVTVKDSTTGLRLANANLNAVRTENQVDVAASVTDTTKYPVNLASLDDAGGTYAITIQVPGYATWTKTVVGGDPCKSTTVEVTALMQRAP